MNDLFGGNFNKFMKKAMGGSGVTDRKNPSISGAGNIKGGKFDSLNISGSGEVDGDVDAKDVEISGAGTIDGDLKAGSVTSSGSLSVDGSVEADTLELSGSTEIEGDVKADEVDNGGSFSAGGDVEAKKFKSRGAFGIEGKLEADEIDIRLHGDSEAKELKGGEITVKRVKSSVSGSSKGGKVVVTTSKGGSSSTVVTGGTQGRGGGFGMAIGIGVAEGGSSGNVKGKVVVSGGDGGDGERKARLKTKRIEGDTVELENTTADLVKGGKVIIGRGCKIKTVEYTDSIEVNEKATVDKQVKV